MNVYLTEKTTGKTLGPFSVNWLGGYPQPREYFFQAAWEDAVADELVRQEDRNTYEFRMSN